MGPSERTVHDYWRNSCALLVPSIGQSNYWVNSAINTWIRCDPSMDTATHQTYAQNILFQCYKSRREYTQWLETFSRYFKGVFVCPLIGPKLTLHLFCSFKQEYLAGGKIRVQEIGPYVYEEKWVRENVSWSQDETQVSFRMRKTYHHRPDLSQGSLSDPVILPNVPMFVGPVDSSRQWLST